MLGLDKLMSSALGGISPQELTEKLQQVFDAADRLERIETKIDILARALLDIHERLTNVGLGRLGDPENGTDQGDCRRIGNAFCPPEEIRGGSCEEGSGDGSEGAGKDQGGTRGSGEESDAIEAEDNAEGNHTASERGW